MYIKVIFSFGVKGFVDVPELIIRLANITI